MLLSHQGVEDVEEIEVESSMIIFMHNIQYR